MKKESEFQRNIDIGKIFESTLLGIFILLGNYVNSLYLFFRHPREFAGMLDEESREKTTSNYKIVRPLTFLTMSLAVFLVVSVAVYKGTSPVFDEIAAESGRIRTPNISLGDSMTVLFHDGLKEFDLKKIILAALPNGLCVGLFSYMLSRAARKNGLEFGFTKSIGLSSFFIGSAIYGHVIATALISVFYYYSNVPLKYIEFWWYWIGFWLLFVVILLFPLFYSYLAILKTELNISWTRSLVVWYGGFWRFLLCFWVILLFTLPLLTAFNLQSHIGLIGITFGSFSGSEVGTPP